VTMLVIGLLFVVLGTVAYVALRNAQDFSDANEVVPGVRTNAPKAWAGAHSPEARLHRRLRDAMTALRANRALDEPALVEVREAIQCEALAIDDRLVAAAALPKGVRDEPLRHVAQAVDAVEQAVAEVVIHRGPGAGDTAHALDAVRTRLAMVEAARAELELLGGTALPTFGTPEPTGSGRFPGIEPEGAAAAEPAAEPADGPTGKEPGGTPGVGEAPG